MVELPMVAVAECRPAGNRIPRSYVLLYRDATLNKVVQKGRGDGLPPPVIRRRHLFFMPA
jgi:hypothetical protein